MKFQNPSPPADPTAKDAARGAGRGKIQATLASDLAVLAPLFSVELDAPTRDALSSDARLAASLPADLQAARVEFTRLFTLSVYPYGSVFLDRVPELNGPATARVEQFYERAGFDVPRAWMVGAADALGVELACAAWLLERGQEERACEFLREHVVPWAPVCCLALERSAQLDFYRTLAGVTRELVLGEAERLGGAVAPEAESEEAEERDLRWVVDVLTTPARSGIFLSKEDLRRMAAEVEAPIGFGDRGTMLMSLLRGAGEQDRVPAVLEALRGRVGEWRQEYEQWAAAYPRAAAAWGVWRERAQATQVLLEDMLRTAQNGLPEQDKRA